MAPVKYDVYAINMIACVGLLPQSGDCKSADAATVFQHSTTTLTWRPPPSPAHSAPRQTSPAHTGPLPLKVAARTRPHCSAVSCISFPRPPCAGTGEAVALAHCPYSHFQGTPVSPKTNSTMLGNAFSARTSLDSKTTQRSCRATQIQTLPTLSSCPPL